MTEYEEIAERVIGRGIPEWALKMIAQSEDNATLYVVGRWPDEGMTWRSGVSSALHALAYNKLCGGDE